MGWAPWWPEGRPAGLVPCRISRRGDGRRRPCWKPNSPDQVIIDARRGSAGQPTSFCCVRPDLKPWSALDEAPGERWAGVSSSASPGLTTAVSAASVYSHGRGTSRCRNFRSLAAGSTVAACQRNSGKRIRNRSGAVPNPWKRRRRSAPVLPGPSAVTRSSVGSASWRQTRSRGLGRCAQTCGRSAKQQKLSAW